MRTARRTSRSSENEAQKQAALRYIVDAWEEALHDGIEPEMLANAALFASLADRYLRLHFREMAERTPERRFVALRTVFPNSLSANNPRWREEGEP